MAVIKIGQRQSMCIGNYLFFTKLHGQLLNQHETRMTTHSRVPYGYGVKTIIVKTS